MTRRWLTGIGCLPAFLALGLAPAAGGTLPWDYETFQLQPLVQKGSGNLLPPLAEGGLAAPWRGRGAARVVAVEGEPAIELGPRQDDDAAALAIALAVTPARLYELRFRYRFSADAAFDYSRPYPGLHGWLTPRWRNGKTTGAVRIRARCRLGGWATYRTLVYVSAEAPQLSLSLGFNATAGRALVADLVLREQPVAGAEGRSLLVTNVETYAETPRHPEPPAPRKPTVFHRLDPDELFFHSRPRPGEVQAPIELAASPGETAVATVAAFAPQALEAVRPRIGTPRQGDQRLDGAITWRVVKYRPRRTDFYGRGLTFHYVPDFFLDRPNGVAARAGETVAFWLQVAIGEDAAPGRYEGSIELVAGDRTLGSLPLRVEVYPFRLLDPADRRWGIYTDWGRWGEMTDEQVLAELRDLKAHGMDAVFVPSRGTPVVRGGKVVGWEWWPQTLRAMPMAREARLRGPWLLWLERLPDGVREALGLPDTAMDGPPDKLWDPRIREGCLAALRLIRDDWARRGWGEPVYVGIDEPGYWKRGSPAVFQWQYRLAREAGLATYCTSSYLPSDPLGRDLAYHCYGGCDDGPGRAAAIREATHAAGQRYWFYATGCYSGQVGRLVRNRYYAGFVFYRSGADGCMSWTYQRPRTNAFDDFVGTIHGQACITYPDPEHKGGSLDTPHWEGLRQGWLDHCYAATLARAIAEARQDPKRRAAAVAGERRFQTLLDEMPWGGDVFGNGEVTNARCDAWRRAIAAVIVGLQPSK